MRDVRRPGQTIDEEGALSAAPEPVLGLDADPAQERRSLVRSRIALGFSIAAFLLALVYVGCLLLGFRMGFIGFVFVYVCWTIGLGLGISARRTRNGKVAIAISLLILVLGIMGL